MKNIFTCLLIIVSLNSFGQDSGFIIKADYDSIINFKRTNSFNSTNVKGWVRYWKIGKGFHLEERIDSLVISGTKYLTRPSLLYITDSSTLVEVKERAIAVYRINSVFNYWTDKTSLVIHSGWKDERELIKILLADGEEFDLSKEYRFIPDDKIVK